MAARIISHTHAPSHAPILAHSLTHSPVLLLVTCFRTQGSENSMFYLITHGKVKVMQQNAPGVLAGERELATLEQGNYFGERAILKTEPAMASVRADKDGVTCYTLDRIHFNKILGSSLKAQVSSNQRQRPHSKAAILINSRPFPHTPCDSLTRSLKSARTRPSAPSVQSGRTSSYAVSLVSVPLVA